jgi:hypothetical protein
LGSSVEVVLEGLAYRLLFHRFLFCLMATKSASGGAIHPRLKRGFLARFL